MGEKNDCVFCSPPFSGFLESQSSDSDFHFVSTIGEQPGMFDVLDLCFAVFLYYLCFFIFQGLVVGMS